MKMLKNFPYSDVLVLGLAKSGTAAAKILLRNNIRVTINDLKANEKDPLVKELTEMGANLIIGSHPLSVLNGIELIVKNPGIPYDNVIVQEAEKRKIPIITEVELAYRFIENDLIAVTGSNGKTTTTTLIAKFLEKSKQKVQLAGNIGNVAVEVANHLKKDEKMVLELSSFQLLGTPTLRADVAVLLNLYEAHLDFHQTFQNYKEAKAQIFANQTENDYLIYNIDDERVVDMVRDARSIRIPFSTKKRLDSGIWTDEEFIYFRTEKIINRKEIVLVGEHNLENILAAIGAAKVSGATNEGIRKILRTFYGVKHRLQFIDQINGRYFYNDSKATNVLATQKALKAFQRPIILLAGGLDRGNNFTALIPYLRHVKALILFGETAPKLKEIGELAKIDQIKMVEDVSDAVHVAYQLSERGDIILLSPACASWDQYRTFEERGDMFIHAVHKLA